MSDTPENASQPREGQPLAVPASTTMAGALDLGTEKDRGLLRQAARRRWPVPDQLKADSVVALDSALKLATEAKDVGEIVDVVRTVAIIEKHNQDDEHLAEKNGRIDVGKPTERVAGFEGVTIIVPGMKGITKED